MVPASTMQSRSHVTWQQYTSAAQSFSAQGSHEGASATPGAQREWEHEEVPPEELDEEALEPPEELDEEALEPPELEDPLPPAAARASPPGVPRPVGPS